tara:strand:- start:50 stop:1069 length:1020 start_codon:yes stop_codon:yes gene_type:complete
MTYVFIFTGEFGYELLNWNGVVRKWCFENTTDKDTIVICSRPGMELIYEMADYYIDMSEIDAYNNSIADCYWSHVRDDNNHVVKYGPHQTEILSTIQALMEDSGLTNVKYIFSPQVEYMNGCTFGKGGLYGPERLDYGRLDVNNNLYRKFTADISCQSEIEEKIGISLDEPFILCQTAARNIVKRDKTKLEIDEFIKALSDKYPVICLGFDTGKFQDSKSSFNDISSKNIHYCNVSTLKEQSCLIKKSKHCVFFSEGDFRSHMYVPPFFGKSLTAVASKAILNPSPTDRVSTEPGKSNAPLNFWNEHVWNFGGKIEPLYYEELASSNNYDDIIKKIIKD